MGEVALVTVMAPKAPSPSPANDLVKSQKRNRKSLVQSNARQNLLNDGSLNENRRSLLIANSVDHSPLLWAAAYILSDTTAGWRLLLQLLLTNSDFVGSEMLCSTHKSKNPDGGMRLSYHFNAGVIPKALAPSILLFHNIPGKSNSTKTLVDNDGC